MEIDKPDMFDLADWISQYFDTHGLPYNILYLNDMAAAIVDDFEAGIAQDPDYADR